MGRYRVQEEMMVGTGGRTITVFVVVRIADGAHVCRTYDETRARDLCHKLNTPIIAPFPVVRREGREMDRSEGDVTRVVMRAQMNNDNPELVNGAVVAFLVGMAKANGMDEGTLAVELRRYFDHVGV